MGTRALAHEQTLPDLEEIPGNFMTRKWSEGRGQIGAGIAESDFGTAPQVRDALVRAVSSDFLTYLPEATAEEAENAAAQFFADRYGWPVDPADVHLIPDVVEGLRVVLRHFCPQDSRVIVPTPAYPPFLTVPAALGREVIQLPSRTDADGRWQVDTDTLGDMAAPGDLVILCNPHNPLGQVMTSDDLAAVTAAVERAGARVFADEIHAPIIYAGARHLPYAMSSDAAAEHTMTATATSKGWNIPGLKVAQLILSNDRDRRIWTDTRPYTAQAGSILGAVAATAAYRDSREWLDTNVAQFDENRHMLASLLAEHLPDIRWRMPEATYLAWLDFSALSLPDNPATFLQQHAGVVALCGTECGAGFESYVRFNFAMHPDRLRAAIHAIADAVRRVTP